MEIPELDAVHSRVCERRIINRSTKRAAAAFHVRRRAAKRDAAVAGDICFAMMPMVVPIAGRSFPLCCQALLFRDRLIAARGRCP